MSKTISLHFRTDGEGIMNMAKRIYFWEDEERAIHILRAFKDINIKQINKVINGQAKLLGTSICGKPDCDQCKDETSPLRYVEEKDQDWLNEIEEEFGDKIKLIVPQMAYGSSKQKKKIVWIRKNSLNNYVHTFTRAESTIKNMNLQYDYGRISKEQKLSLLPDGDGTTGSQLFHCRAPS